jgi:hypothetical protein
MELVVALFPVPQPMTVYRLWSHLTLVPEALSFDGAPQLPRYETLALWPEIGHDADTNEVFGDGMSVGGFDARLDVDSSSSFDHVAPEFEPE